MTARRLSTLLCLLTLTATPAMGADLFAKQVGDVARGDCNKKDVLEAPFLTWGGDVATFHANGGVDTASGSLYDQLGLKVKAVNGDDFVAQVRRYIKGETPLLRGTMRMIGMASEVIGTKTGTRPVVFLQLTWSAGDHVVARAPIRSLGDLKGKKIVLQAGGPHVGMLDDALRAASLTWKDITVVWAKDLTGTENSPAAMFRKDSSIDACCVISPDMFALAGDLNSVGTGVGNSIKGAHVLVSTAQMSRSIADVYACREDYFKANRAQIERFAAGYLKACEEVVALKRHYEHKNDPKISMLAKRNHIIGANKYFALLGIAQGIFGKEIMPSLENDVHGLISDCSYVGLPGNVAFFNDKGNLSGFRPKQNEALQLAVNEGYATTRQPFLAPNFDYNKLRALGKMSSQAVVKRKERFGKVEVENLFPEEVESTRSTILSFTIYFKGNQYHFSVARYGSNFERAIKAASTFGNAVIGIGGHADNRWLLGVVEKEGVRRGVLRKIGTDRFILRGKTFDLNDSAAVIREIKRGTFGSRPIKGLNFLNDLSKKRAANVRQAIIQYAASRGYHLDVSQIKSVAVGVREPAVTSPKNFSGSKKNMRVEFRVIKVNPEQVSPDESGFDY